jgi:predicted  nucleic acid-binding Zn-ribbon protein
MKSLIFSALLLSTSAHLFAADTEKTLEQTRAILDKWVDQRKAIADRKAAWVVEKQTLEESIRLYQKELDDLSRQIKEAEAQSSAADKERVDLEDKEKLLLDAAQKVTDVIDGYETRLLTLARAFPDPLTKKIAEFLRKIPDEKNRKEKSLSERVQTVVAILGEVDKFNNSVSGETEFRKGADGNEIAVDTLYLGLGQGYFAAKEGAYAGIGYPENGKWVWVDKPELADRIRDSLAMFRNTKPAQFVGLEVITR